MKRNTFIRIRGISFVLYISLVVYLGVQMKKKIEL